MDEFDTPIRLRPDGSIDTAYYIARSRELRSRQALDMAAEAGRTPGRLTRLLGRVLTLTRIARA
ncbi:hypothetical protein [Pseudooceanicola atlanticus]|jgi:hypothetical protein|uniref:Uncharacterized protein n=1 Tax=Pseudooceanicola atlanticus TaxID=1461694 RepID=A0A0A0EDK4_9RHOB|nr:hypothetical protein [Pseudooceanicola atlanticus]KGM48494.1 hypothetical protein ATO9_12745 [Pseudooceanicola atlanticus]